MSNWKAMAWDSWTQKSFLLDTTVIICNKMWSHFYDTFGGHKRLNHGPWSSMNIFVVGMRKSFATPAMQEYKITETHNMLERLTFLAKFVFHWCIRDSNLF